ncbi:hydrogenase maturation protease [Rhodococcus sp. HM1]|uniref:hydrogenase maturation protease n=1 Tax=unclassified Rhodococcus (in: high G+C Gram-positive bacteria) TaxID=192944 RepID=UPI0018CCDF96|nr:MULTISPECIES: hydrogenase maturation protease [unclassified Rhodococcus (in: high G+C Gram-positive bacteria)]MBH0119219.1 hydrogenase maturation protease [Rhodococcus sp. CX]MCK8673148.1 hydrogenase maturation protease [Rhodococcus sp. HM1]
MRSGVRILVAGVGNIFLGDDGFGPEVVRYLARSPKPEGVRVVDYGIRGMHLAYDLLDGWDGLVLVDAVPDAGEPGAVRVFEAGDTAPTTVGVDAHGMDPASVFATLAALGGSRPRTIVVGCQAQCVDEGIGLSPAVAAAVEPAAAAVRRAVQNLRRPDRAARPRPGG